MQNTGQSISTLEGQMSQLASFISERPKGTLPSELITNSRNFSQAHVAQKDPMNQCNVVHTLRSRKQVNNQVSMPPDPTQTSTPSSSTPPTSKDKSAGQVHKPTTPFPNRFRSNNNAQMKKILEIFNQVKINVPLFDAIQQVPSYSKFLKDMCTKKRKPMC